jgi:hypothetical protein
MFHNIGPRLAKLKNISTDAPEQYREQAHHHHGKGSLNSELNLKWIDYKGELGIRVTGDQCYDF